MTQQVDVIIIGQGFAGTTLAWRMIEAGLKVAIITRNEVMSTASQIAAGLVTPVTGKRFAVTWEWDKFAPEADEFYSRICSVTGLNVWRSIQMMRLFNSTEERDLFDRKFDGAESWLASKDAKMEPPLISHIGGFEMMGWNLMSAPYLNESHHYFRENALVKGGNIDSAHDIRLDQDGVTIPRFKLSARYVVFCQGYQSNRPKEFDRVRFNPAKGEIVCVKIPGCSEHRVVYQDCFMLPTVNEHFLIGSTYDWNDLSDEVTSTARDELLGKLRKFVTGEIEVIHQYTAIRPTMHDFRPVIGMHPEIPNIGIMNGLGSKGVLMAPRLARLLTEHILDGHPIPHEVSLARWFN